MNPELPFRLCFGLLLLLLFVLRMTWHLRARIQDPGASSPDEGWMIRAVRWVTLPVWFVVVGGWLFVDVRWLSVPLPELLRWAGAGLSVGGLVLLAVVHQHLGQNFSPYLRIRHDHQLITTGPYRRIRHPMYTAFLLILGGLSLLAANGFLLVSVVLMMIALLAHRLPREERMLQQRFGAEYEAWRARTGLLLPR